MIETLQGYYVDLDPFRYEARVVNQVAKKGDGTSIYLEADFINSEDEHVGVAKCEFWFEQTPRGTKITMVEILASMPQPVVIRDKLFAGAAPRDDAALDQQGNLAYTRACQSVGTDADMRFEQGRFASALSLLCLRCFKDLAKFIQRPAETTARPENF